jgi:hypothetical protein
MVGEGEMVGEGDRGRNDPNIVCTYEYMNNFLNKLNK